MFSALKHEKCNYVSLVPTMVVALSTVKKATGQNLPYLKSIMLAGTAVSPLVIHQCTELGAKEVENTYGMTDGVYYTTGSQRDISMY
jgi:acyl-CoA synthetase (AMP-forming)/AMP-acid ligase II